MSVTKLLGRVVANKTTIDYNNELEYTQKNLGGCSRGEMHEFTFGITSDPMIEFACALSALIHDADHTGLPNAQVCTLESLFRHSRLYSSLQ